MNEKAKQIVKYPQFIVTVRNDGIGLDYLYINAAILSTSQGQYIRVDWRYLSR